jgi:hypothetical protein
VILVDLIKYTFNKQITGRNNSAHLSHIARFSNLNKCKKGFPYRGSTLPLWAMILGSTLPLWALILGSTLPLWAMILGSTLPLWALILYET